MLLTGTAGTGLRTLTTATTASGNITIDADGGDITVTTMTASSGGGVGNISLTADAGTIRVGSVTAAGDDITVTASGQILESGSDATADLVSNTLTLAAGTGIGTTGTLEINATTLTSASVSLTGLIDLEDTAGGLVATSVTTASGNISLDVRGGNLTATLISAGTGASGDGNVTITTITSGSVLLDTMSAAGDAVTITTATGGTINEIAPSDAGIDITANSLNLTGAAGIGTTGVIEIDANTLTALTTAAGVNAQINLSDRAGGLIVTSAKTSDGDIALDAFGGGNLTVTTASAGGTMRNVLLTTETGGSVVIGNATEADGTITINSSAAIEESGIDTAADLTAATIHLTAVTGVGNLGKIEINAVTLDVDTTSGAINLSDLAGGLHVTSATTGNGTITLNATGGNLTVDQATAGAAATAGDGNITLTTTTSGNIEVGLVTAELDQVTITTASLGTITEQAPSNGIAAVVAANITLTGSASIGTPGAAGKFEIDATNSLTASTTNTGDRSINILDVAGGLNVTSATTGSGSIVIEAVGGTMNAATVTAGGTNKTVTLITTTSGDVNVGNVTATSDMVTINSAGAIEELGSDGTADITSTNLNLTAATGIGALGRIEVRVVNAAQIVTTMGDIGVEDTSGGLTVTLAQTGGGNIDLRASTTLTVTDVIAGTIAAGDGNVSLRSGGTSTLTILGDVTAGDDSVTLIAGTSGAITANGAGALVTAANGFFTANGGMNVNTTLSELTAATTSGSLVINETNSLLLNSATTTTGSVTLTLANNGTLTGKGAGTHIVSSGTTSTATLNAGGGIHNLNISTARLAADTSGNNGYIDITETNGLQINSINAGTGDVSLHLLAGNLTQVGSITADELQVINDGGSVTLTFATNNVATLAGRTNGGSFSYTDADALTIGTVQVGALASTSGIDTGATVNGGSVTINAGGMLTVSSAVDTSTGSGGTLSLGSGVDISSTITVGSGNVTLNGGGAAVDTIIGANITVAGNVLLNVERDIIVRATLQTTSGGNISLIADSDADGVGGVRVEAAGQVNSAGTVVLQGSDLYVTGAVASDAVRIDADGVNAQVLAVGSINIQANAIAAATAKTYFEGLVQNTSGGITFQNAVILTGNAFATAGAGAITFQKSIDGASDLTLSAGTGSVSLLGNIGVTTAIQKLTVARADAGVTIGTDASPVTQVFTNDAIDLGQGTNRIGGTGIVLNGGSDNNNTGATDSRITITTSGDQIRFNGAVFLNSDATITTGSTTGGDIVFTNDAPLNSTANETNDLLLTAGTGAVRFNEDIGGTRNLNTFTITRADGGVYFGESDIETDGAGTVGSVNLVNAAGKIDLGSIDVIGGTGIVFNGGAGTIVIQTSGDDVRINGAVLLQSNTQIDTSTGTGNITFTSAATINSQDGTIASGTSVGIERNNLLLDAGGGRVVFNANIGTTQRLGDLTVDRASLGVVFGGADTAIVGGAGPVTRVETDGAIDIGSGTTSSDVIGTAVGGVGIILNGGSSGLITFQTSNDSIRFNGPVWMQTDVRLDTDEGAAGTPSVGVGNITFTAAATINSQNGTFNSGTSVGSERNDLVLDAGDGRVSFNANIGVVQRPDMLIVERAQSGVVIGGSDSTSTISGGAARVQTINTDGAIVIGLGTGVAGTIDLTTGTSADAEIGGVGIVLNGGSGTLTIQTSDDDIQFNGAVKLQSDVRLDTDQGVSGTPSLAAGGNILFTRVGTINSQNGTVATPSVSTTERNDLTIDAGDRLVVFNADIGATQRINLFTIERAGAGIVFGGADSSLIPGGAGAVTQVLTESHMDFGKGTSPDSVIGGVGIVLNGGSSGLITLQTTNDNIRFNGAVWLQSSAFIDHNEGGPLDPIPGTGTDNITFTSAATINSQNGTFLSGTVIGGERNSLTIENGDALLSFNADIGTVQRIGNFVVTRSQNGVEFGGADVATTGGTGPISNIWTDGYIDIGQGTGPDNVIQAKGIVFNGGPGNVLTVSTTGDSVRLNGMVTLSSDVRIDTDSTDTNTEGGNVLFTNDASIDSQSNAGVTEANDLVIDAGTASVLFNEDIGAKANGQLGRLIVEEADISVVFGQADDETGIDTGSVNFVTLVGDATGTTGVTALNLGSLDIIGSIFFNGGGANSRDADDTQLLNNTNDDTLTITTTSDDVRFNGAVRLDSDVRIDTDETANTTGGADILFTNDAAIDSFDSEANDLVLDAGVASVFFNEDIGAGTNGQLGQLIVEEADTAVVFGQAATDDNGTSPLNDGGVVNQINLVGDTGTGSDATDDLNLGSIEILGAIVFNGGNSNSRLTGGAGLNNTNDDTLTITTTSDDVRFNGAVRLDSDVRIDTDETANTTGGADILFTNDAAIDSFDSEANDLVLDAGVASVFFNEDIGAGTNGQLGQLIVEEADTAVVFGQAATDDNGTSPLNDGGVVNQINLVGDTGTGSDATYDLNLGSVEILGAIVFNGGPDNDNVGVDSVLTVTTTDDSVRFNGATRLNSDVVITTGLSGAGDITFTTAATIDSQVGERNDLTLETGTGDIRLSADIGANDRLNNFLITQARNVDLDATGSLRAWTVTQNDGTGITTLNGAVIVDSTNTLANGIRLRNDAIVVNSAVSTAGTRITLTADAMEINPGTGSLDNTTDGLIQLWNKTAGKTISLGTETVGSLSLKDSELDKIHTGTLLIGRLATDTDGISGNTSVASGTITVKDAISLDPMTATTTLHLRTAGNLVADANGLLIVTNLGIETIGNVSLTNSNDVEVLTAQIIGAGSTFEFTDSNDLQIGRIDPFIGTTSSLIGLKTNNGDIKLTVGDELHIDDDVAAGTADVTLTVGTIGTQSLGNDITAHGLQLLGNGSFELQNTTNNVSTIAGQTVGQIRYTDADNLGIGIVSSSLNASSSGIVATGQLVSLTSVTGGLIDGNGATTNITSGSTALRAATGIGSGDALETSVSLLSARNTGSGSIQIDNVSGQLLTISTVDLLSGIVNNGASQGNIVVTNNASILVSDVLASPTNAPITNSTGGNINLLTNGGAFDITVNSPLTATGGNGTITLNAGRDIVINDTGVASDVSVVGGGQVLLTAANDIVLGSQDPNTTPATIQHTVANDVVIQTASGAITNTTPLLFNVVTPQISALGEATVSGDFGRPGEHNITITVYWGDGTSTTQTFPDAGHFEFHHTYLGNPNAGDPSAPILINAQVEHDPNVLMMAANVNTSLLASDVNSSMATQGQPSGPNFIFLDQTAYAARLTTPGDGLASFAFDVTPPVVLLTLPEAAKFLDVLQQSVAQLTDASTLRIESVRSDESVASERLVSIEVLSPDGTVRERVLLPETVLDDMYEVIGKLPDGKYRIQLQEVGEEHQRLLLEFEVRQGKIADGTDAGDRPPSAAKAKMSPMPDDVDDEAADALQAIEAAGEDDSAMLVLPPVEKLVEGETDRQGESPISVSRFEDGARTSWNGWSSVAARRAWMRAERVADDAADQAEWPADDSQMIEEASAETIVSSSSGEDHVLAGGSVMLIGAAAVLVGATSASAAVRQTVPQVSAKLSRAARLFRKYSGKPK